MTLRATLHGDRIAVHGTYRAPYGTASFEITEPLEHARHFWGELGDLIREAEHEAESVPAIEVVNLPVDDQQQAYEALGHEDSLAAEG